MLMREILVGERSVVVDTRAPRTIGIQKIPALDHEAFYHAVELGRLVALRFGGDAVLPSAELAEVLGRARD